MFRPEALFPSMYLCDRPGLRPSPAQQVDSRSRIHSHERGFDGDQQTDFDAPRRQALSELTAHGADALFSTRFTHQQGLETTELRIACLSCVQRVAPRVRWLR